MLATMTCHGAEWTRAMNRKPAMPAAAATTSTGRAPNRSMNLPLTNATRKPVRAPGRQVDDAGFEHGRAEAVSRCLMRDLDELGQAEEGEVQSHAHEDRGEVGQHDRVAGLSISVDTSGCFARRSQSHQPTRTMTPHAAQPRVLGEVQPQEWPWVIASSIADRPAAEARGAQPVDGARRAARPRRVRPRSPPR